MGYQTRSWEYQIIESPLSVDKLDALGSHGWELVNCELQADNKVVNSVFKRATFDTFTEQDLKTIVEEGVKEYFRDKSSDSGWY